MESWGQPDYTWLYAQTRAGRERGPEVARTLLGRLGHPEGAFDSVRVIGTNGKGSTCAMLEAGLLACGVRTGRFTSPHLHTYEERIRRGGRPLDPARTAAFIRWAKEEGQGAAFFDLTFALACQAFAEAGTELAVMEAGVGGASDATQALTRVRATLITNVALDHVPTLGQTVAEIARDKAGAAQAGIPLLTTAQGEGLEVITEVAAAAGAPLYTPASHPALFALPAPPRLAGAHQRQNAALALAALRLLGYPEGAAAALGARHPGRLEGFRVGGKMVWVDGAHNPHAAQALALEPRLARADVLLFGGLARKDTDATLAPLLGLARERVFTAPGDLASPPTLLAGRWGGEAEPDPHRALERALALTPEGGTVLVAGSLYLAGLIRERLLALGAEPQD